MTSLRRRGLSAVRPEMSAIVGPCVMGVISPCERQVGSDGLVHEGEKKRWRAGGSGGGGGATASRRRRRRPCSNYTSRGGGARAGKGVPRRSTHLDVEVRHVLAELGAVRRLHLIRPRLEGLAGRRIGARAKEPRLDDGGELRGGHVAVEHLLRVIPAHAALRHAAPDQHHIACLRGSAAQIHRLLEARRERLLLVGDVDEGSGGRRARDAARRQVRRAVRREQRREEDRGDHCGRVWRQSSGRRPALSERRSGRRAPMKGWRHL